MPDNMIYSDGNDPDMDRAMQRARETFRLFWRELSWEYRRIVPAFDMTMIKVGLPTDSPDADCEMEHLWASEVECDGRKVKAVLVNQPNWIAGYNQGDAVEIPLAQVEDWMINFNDCAFGGFTVQVLRARMGSGERREHDQAWGLNFADPADTRVVIDYAAKAHKLGMLARLFGRSGKSVITSADVDLDNPPEHPMSEQMGDKVAEAIASNPHFLTEPDESGWTMLQRESLAGNLLPVKILVEQGADPSLTNPNGHTALDLARLFSWQAIIRILS